MFVTGTGIINLWISVAVRFVTVSRFVNITYYNEKKEKNDPNVFGAQWVPRPLNKYRDMLTIRKKREKRPFFIGLQQISRYTDDKI